MKIPVLVISFFCLALWPLRAENFDRIAPKPAPPLNAEKSKETGDAAEPKPQPAATANSEASTQVLLPKLIGLVFIPNPQSAHKEGVTAQGVELRNVTVPNETAFRKLVQDYIGKPFTQGDLSGINQKIVLYYREHDHPVVDVIVPEQEITNGVIQFVILEGKVGDIEVKGNRWFSSDTIRNDIRLRAGDPISNRGLQSDLEWSNSNPFHSSEAIFQAGKSMGATDIVINTHDRFPLRPFAGYDDSGTQITGYDHYLAGFNWGDAFHLGLNQQLNYQYTTSGSGRSYKGQSGSYVVPLPWQNTLTLFGSYVESRATIPPFIGIKGRSYQISGKYEIPLPTYRSKDLNIHENFSLGFDYKYNDNALEFGEILANDTVYDVDQFVFGYSASEQDAWGQTTVLEQLTFSPGGFGGHNQNTYFSDAHFLARSDYTYNNIVLERVTHLPGDFSLILRGTQQLSSGNLAPSEQLGFGGYNTIRGYDEREINTDEGIIFTTEVRTPSISFGKWADSQEVWNDQMQFLGFWDYGVANNHSLLKGENGDIGENMNTELSALGVGFRYSVSNYVSVRFDYGFQLLHTGADLQHDSRGHVGVTIAY